MNSIGNSIPNSTRCRMTCRTNCALMPCCWSSLARSSAGPASIRSVDTLKGSRHANMKELRFEASDGEWRAAFAFDPERKAILLVAGDKSGGSEKRFYKQIIAKADFRFSAHVERLKAAKKGK